jgi:decaprenyl-phosphate phosphoribosyltransferase
VSSERNQFYKARNFSLLISVMRPRQWVKNVLVFAAPVTAGFWQSFSSYVNLILAFVGFCLVSSFGYIVNDLVDRVYDSQHPTKRKRPFASGELGMGSFIFLSCFLLLGYVSVCWQLPIGFVYISLIYLFITLSYSFFLKSIPVVEMVWLSLGFLLRPLAGASAINIPVSEWFLIVTSFGAIFLIATKRLAEFKRSSTEVVRPVVRLYSETFLTTVITLSIGVALTAYSLWAFNINPNSFWTKLSVASVVLGMLRYAWHFERGDAEAPDVMIWRDPVVILSGLFSLVLVVLAVQLDG